MRVPLFSDANRGWATLVLVALLILGGLLRLSHLGASGLWLDEILNVSHITPEHGPLHRAVVDLGLALHREEAGARLPFALVGLATIWLMYRTARAVLPRPESLVAATLLAVTPLHVYHSREVKPYPLLVAACALACWALLRLARAEGWAWRREWWWHVQFALSALLLLVISSHGSFYMGALIVGYVLLVFRAPPWRARRLHLVCIVGVSLLVLLLFWSLYGHIVTSFGNGPLLPSTDWMGRMAQGLVSGYTEDRTPSPLLLLALAAAAIGVVSMLRTRTQMLAGLIAMAVCLLGFFVPMVMLRLEGHGLAVRYELPALIPLIVLIAAGIGAICRLLAGPRPSLAMVLTGAIAVATIQAQYGEVQRAIHGNADWRQIATFIKQRAHPGDVVISSNDWGQLCLDYYLLRVGAHVRLENAQESIDRAKALMAANKEGFVIAGGAHTNRARRPVSAGWLERGGTGSPADGLPLDRRHPRPAVSARARASAADPAAARDAVWPDRTGAAAGGVGERERGGAGERQSGLERAVDPRRHGALAPRRQHHHV